MKDSRKFVDQASRSTCRVIQASDCMKCAIRKHAVFHELNFEEFSELHRRVPSQQCAIKARQHAYSRGDARDVNMVLLSGWIILYNYHQNGSRQIFHIALPGEFIPVNFSEGGTIDHSAMAITDVELCAFDRESLYQALLAKSVLLKPMLAYSEKMVRLCMGHIDALGRKSAEGKIAFLLLEILHRLDAKNWKEGEPVYFPLTQEHLGDWAGLTAVHVNRTLSKFRSRGILEISNKRLVLNDLVQLTDIASW